MTPIGVEIKWDPRILAWEVHFADKFAFADDLGELQQILDARLLRVYGTKYSIDPMSFTELLVQASRWAFNGFSDSGVVPGK